MLPDEKILYWFTPFFKREDVNRFLSSGKTENRIAFFCFDSYWNRTGNEELHFLKNEFEKHGAQLILMEGSIEKTVPSVARVLKVSRVDFSNHEFPNEFETAIKKICRDLELHSIAFCHPHSVQGLFHRGGDHYSTRQAI